MYSNAAINPIIYAGFNDSFRKCFKDLINGITKRNSPTASESFETEYKQRSILRARNTINGTTLRTVTGMENGTMTNGVNKAKETETTKTEDLQKLVITTDSLMISSKL